ncbi:MAG: adenylyl-sulfate kinase [Methyloversatilis discipulorum]|uniref:adenylyl-sulfate kinase n=1 Tax=Methyloversatilis discipulorum TaxID=1119528 RepID=UPI0026F04914|nr:adenylyl-sulfate kinase [Methyloversatilis discipulorum]MBV5287130.1 adenylyl-sulfate kinase [Methyloversatilis discipulorum]
MNTENARVLPTELARPTVIWITGYSGAGKTTVGRKVNFRLNEKGVKSVFLDGDDLRAVLGGKWGYEKDDRIALAHSYFRLANLLMAQGVTVVISAVAMYQEVHAWIKTNVDRSLVVYLDVPEEERRLRDRATKNVYGQLGDLAQLYDHPDFADLVVPNSGGVTPDVSAEMILEAARKVDAPQRPDKGRDAHWNAYYSGGQLIGEPSSFAQLVATEVQSPARLLEVGCGNGRDSLFFASRGFRVTALDPSRAAIDVCRASAGGERVEFIHGVASQLTDTYAALFNVAYSRFCLHAMTEAEEIDTLEAVQRALQPGARFYIECRSINDPLARKGEVISATERIHGHYRRFIVLDELKARLDRAGFDTMWADEADNVAAISGDNPVVIRIAAVRR